MRGGLDETLARLERREEARRRRGTEPGDEPGRHSAVDDPAGPDNRAGTVHDRHVAVHDRTGTVHDRHVAVHDHTGEVHDRRIAADDRRIAADDRGGAAGGGDPVAEVAEAVRRVVAAHPGLTVVVRVEHGGRAYPLRIARDGTGVTVGPDRPGTPPPAWPLSTRTVPSWPGPDGLSSDPATRLAELIRRDPGLLDGAP